MPFYGVGSLSKYKKATAQESISIEAIRNVLLPISPINEQKRIVARLEQLLPLCDELMKHGTWLFLNGAGIGKVSCTEKGKQYDSECQQAHRYTGILQ